MSGSAPPIHTGRTTSVPRKIDLKPFILNLYIVEKDLGVTRLADIIHPAQIAVIDYVNYCINENIPCRVIVLKARQIGMSTIIEAIQFALAFLRNRFRGLVVAHEMGSSEHLLSMTQNYFDEFWAEEAYTQKNKSTKVLSWVETKSMIGISTARNIKSARGRTIQFLHGSEVGFWDNADILMTGLAQAIPSLPLTFIFMESTANGIGNYFHTSWEEACSGEIDYHPMFFPWYTHPEYLGSKLNLPMIEGHLDKEERALVKLMKAPPRERWNDYTSRPVPPMEILDRLTWRRYAIKNLCKSDLHKFHQEYPTTPEEAFISTGTNIFPMDALDDIFDESLVAERGAVVREGEKVRFQRNIEGRFHVYRKPGKGGDYIVSGDPKRATEGDWCCACVINRRTWQVVAIFRDKCDPITFGEHMMNIGMYYNTALLVPEIEGGGYATIGVLLDRNYPKVWQHEKAETMPGQIDNTFGWHTNWKTKNQAIGTLKKAIIDRFTKFHSREMYKELKNYVALGNGKFGNGEAVDHDDMVMAYAIGITVIHYMAYELLPAHLEPDADVPYSAPTPKMDTKHIMDTVDTSTSAPPPPTGPTVEEWDEAARDAAEALKVLRQEDVTKDDSVDVAEEPPWMNWN